MKTLLLRLGDSGNIEEAITSILKASEKPVGIDTIAYLLNAPSYKVCQSLNKMEKWGFVKKITVSRVSYWK